MFLIHNTLTDYLENILLDQQLKSPSQTGNLNEGYGVYEAK